MTLIKDTLFALRMFARNPGFTAVAVLTLGIGIGMLVAVWSVVDGVLIDPLPYPEADRLMEIQMTEPDRADTGYPMSALAYRDYDQQNQSFEEMAATFRENLNITGGSSPERVAGSWVSAPFFGVVGVPPALGRGFRAEEDAVGAELVAVISHGLWQRRFEGDPGVVGDKVVVNGKPYTVVGVAAAGFGFPEDTELWLPLALDWEDEDRGHGWLVPYGRLRVGVTLDEAQADLDRIAARIAREHPEISQDRGVRVAPLAEEVIGAIRPALLVLVAAAICVLLIASANVSILLMVRTVARQREVALRQALGASRTRLVRQQLTESGLLALAGGAAGLVTAGWLMRLLSLRFGEFIPRSGELGLDLGVFAFALLVTAVTGLLVGVLPALRARENRIMRRLREVDRSVAGRGPKIGTALVAGEIALAVVLLAGAALLTRTFVNLLEVDPGFESDHVLTLEVALTDEGYTEEADRVEFYRRAVQEIGSLPAVASVGTVYPLPLFGRRVSTSSYVEGSPLPGPVARRPLVELRFVSPGYLEAAGLRLAAGRFVEDSDTADAPRVVVVNESFVRQLAPPGDPVGRRTTGYDPSDPEAEWETIVGVVENVRHIDLARESGPEMYVPVAQYGFEWATFVVRVRSGKAASLAESIREKIRRIDPDLPVFNVLTLEQVVFRSLGGENFLTSLLVLFAATGLALASVGVFSVVSYSVGRRVREMAIRMAVGGSRGAVMGLVMRQGLVPVAAGIGVGLVAALATLRMLASRLYGVSAHDPVAFSGTALLILAVAVIATWVPARRATRVEPMSVLRSD